MRAAGMQVLTDQIKAKRPGVTIYGIGDEDHQERTSGHNEDDTSGVSAEDSDPDNKPEHRAIDVMTGSSFSSTDGDHLVNDLVTNPANQVRLIYVNWGNGQWHRKNNWVRHDNSDDPHSYVHISGEADADENTSAWVLSGWGGTPPITGADPLQVDGQLGPKTISRWQQIMGTPVDGEISEPYSHLTAAVQTHLNKQIHAGLEVDGHGIFQDNKRYKTAGALQSYLQSPVDGVLSSPVSQCIKALQRKLNTGKF